MRALPISAAAPERAWPKREASVTAETETDESDLVARVRAGDALAFEVLVGRHMRRAYTVAYRLLGRRQDAEDVVQDSFVAALVKIESFQAGRPFAPWLLRIVANRALNHRAAQARRAAQALPDAVASSEPSPLEAAERTQRRERITRALKALPEPQRWVVQLFDVDGFSGAEIASMLGMPEGTVRWHLHQARQALRATLEILAGTP